MVSSQHVQSFARGLAVIKSFNETRSAQTLSEVAEVTGLSRATARRFLHTLVDEGYATTDGSKFRLTPRVLELGYSYLSSLTLPQVAQPRLEALSAKVSESSSLSVLDDGDIVYVNRVPVRKIMTVAITIGTRFPAFNTSMGRVLLAFQTPKFIKEYLDATEFEATTSMTKIARADLEEQLATARRQGWIIVDQELEPGLRSVAAPVFSPDGRVAAAVNVSTQAAVHSLTDIEKNIVPEVVAAAQLITDDLARMQVA
ncbi:MULTISPECIES: IclR family transcriptional regulator domain-containing protein [unclassified Corynebacterium]|uniref:IclR family transcriptional regulator domain-containing protein n=1 Tax=unclassified Corynebacterium TaxID=2624378 RepID=UPI0030B5B1DA